MAFERHHSILVTASLITVATFVAASVFTQTSLRRIDAVSALLENDAIPSVEHLSQAAVRLTRIGQLLDDGALATQPDRVVSAARDEVVAVNDDVSRYLALTPLTGERRYGHTLRDDVADAVEEARRTIDVESHGSDRGEVLTSARHADAALDRAVRSVLAALEFDVAQSERLAADVRAVRAATLRKVVALDVGASLIAALAVLVAYRASRGHDDLQRAHASLLTARVVELDRFAGRVAHDVLSPLGAAATGLGLASHSADARARVHLARSQRALLLVRHLVEGLLEFARSGARPDPASRCRLDETIRVVASECGDAAAEGGIDLIVEIACPLTVTCTIGAATSIVQNLVRNAINYMGEREERLITMRAFAVGGVARLEVKDTGPGIPRDVQPTVFEPFVRGDQHPNISGTGLGLATVKRLIEGHGGHVGLVSTPGAGTLFWVELPLASSVSTD